MGVINETNSSENLQGHVPKQRITLDCRDKHRIKPMRQAATPGTFESRYIWMKRQGDMIVLFNYTCGLGMAFKRSTNQNKSVS